jgi:ABC-type phosphate/phosphonate transport system substrate-binding protein
MQVLQQGGAAACVVSLRTLSVLPKDLTRNVRAISKPQVVPGALFMAHKRLDQKLRQTLQAEILGWKDNEAGRAVLKSMQLGDFVPVVVADYAKLPKLD